MDTIKFTIEDYIDEKFGFRFPTINIYINNHNFFFLVEEIEQRNKILQGEEPSNSHYVGHDPRYGRDCCDEFLGLHARPYSVLLTCTCTFAECNCIMAKITMDDKTVLWSEIGSPWLSGNSPSPWVPEDITLESGWIPYDYSGLGPFIFEKRKYIDALNALTARDRLFRFIAAFDQSTRW